VEVISLAIPQVALPYLIAQRGAIDDMRLDGELWLRSYQMQLAAEFEAMRPWLPTECASILDVGGGMSGISVWLSRAYEPTCMVTILDGFADPPFVTSHSKTFSNFEVARKFLSANGVRNVYGIDAARAAQLAPRFWDLVVSQKSWCFHFAPSVYLPIVRSGCVANVTRLILDVRTDKPEWLGELSDEFGKPELVTKAAKHHTWLFQP
jgi:hypothetical protein